MTQSPTIPLRITWPSLHAAFAAALHLAPNLLGRLQRLALARACRQTRSLVLTYDDGPGPTLTPCVLDLLAAHDARATFFLLGRQALDHPQLVDALLAAGHEIGCHGALHLHPWRSSPSQTRVNMEQGYHFLSRWLSEEERGGFRPPYGKLTWPMWLSAIRHRHPVAWWTLDSGDTNDTLPTPSQIADRLARAGGGVVLLHDFDRSPPSPPSPSPRTGLHPRHRFVLETTQRLLAVAGSEGLTVRRWCDLQEAPTPHEETVP